MAVWTDGSRYSGTFKDGLPHGHGRKEYKVHLFPFVRISIFSGDFVRHSFEK